jgi:Bacterial extracellular solute-binding proteins, family 5 Middle
VSFGVVGSPATLDPYSPAASDLTYALAVPVYPSLFRLDPRGHPYPYLAKTIQRVPGGVRVTLRRARWSNGRPVSAKDVVKTLNRARPPSGFSRVVSAEPLTRRVVRFQGAVRDWRTALATVAYVLPGGRPRRLSAGPFQVMTYVPGLQIVYRHNDNWWSNAPLDTVKVEFAPSLQVLIMLLQQGRLDAAAPPSSVNLDDRLDALGLHHSDALGWESIQLRFPGRSLSRRDRQTLAAAVERRVFRAGFIRDEGRLSNTLHPGPGPAGAEGLWAHPARAGPPVQGRLALSAPAGDELLQSLQLALQHEMSRVAPDLELVSVEPQTFYGRWKQHNPTQLALARVAGGPGLVGDAHAYRNATALPLFQVETILAWRDDVRGLQADPTFDGPLWNVERWSRAPTIAGKG